MTTPGTTPLLITPLLICQKEEPEFGRYQVVHSLVTPSPYSDSIDGEIETALEVFHGDDGNALWRRVVVRSGPTNPNPIVHASYQLPEDGPLVEDSDAVLCWASFPERPDHKLLCVLANPSLLCIWDVYPQGTLDADLSGEGHYVPLPFEAYGIHALENYGLMLQRVETMEDRMAFDSQQRMWSMAIQGEDDEDGFVLKAPPRPVRLRDSTGTSMGSFISTATNSVPSLFSLSHPLDDVLPISYLPGGELQPGMITDVFERVLFVGVLRWTDPNDAAIDRKEYTQPICVTYHLHRKRHAIWQIKKAPAPPPQAPLWQVSSQWRSDNGWSSHLGRFQQELEDMELLAGPDVDSSHYDAASRNDALADALGIRKTPRKAVEDVGSRPRSVSARPRRSKTAVNNISLLSPMSSRPANDTHIMDVDTSVESSSMRAPLLTMGAFSSLHPHVAMTCLYEETSTSHEAENVFLASNIEASGTLMIGLVCPVNDSTSPSELRLFAIEPANDNSHGNRKVETAFVGESMIDEMQMPFRVGREVSISCVSALPVEASLISPRFHPHQRHCKSDWRGSACDILVLRGNQHGRMGLALYRGSIHVVDCVVDRENSIMGSFQGDIFDIENQTGNRIDIIYITKSNEEVRIRGSVSLRMEASYPCEKMLQALECAIFSTALLKSKKQQAEISLKIRADCARMEQAIRRNIDDSDECSEDAGLKSVRTVVLAMFSLELLGMDVNAAVYDSKFAGITGLSAWHRLLRSDYHQGYSAQNADFLFLQHFDSSKMEISWKTLNSSSSILSRIRSLSLDCLRAFESQISCCLFDALHALYEEFKLYGSSRDVGMRSVASILSRICRMTFSAVPHLVEISSRFLEHYKRDLGEDWFRQLEDCDYQWHTTNTSNNTVFTSNTSPPCILSWIDGMVSGKIFASGYEGQDESSINDACTRTRSLIRIFRLLYSGVDGMALEHNRKLRFERDYAVVRALIEEGFHDPESLRDGVPSGVSLPLLETLHRCRGGHGIEGLSNEDAKMWSLIGRADVCKNVLMSENDSIVSQDKLSLFLNLEKDQREALSDKDKDGISQLEVTSAMFFPDDNRIREVGRLLRSSRPVYLNVKRAIEVSDHDYERMKQEKLLLLSRRVLALPVGRGMFTIGNLQPVPAEPLPLPDLCLVGRVPPTNAMLALDTAECPTDLKVWPEFHNGVAAGLRLPLGKDASEVVSKITRTWIVYNRPSQNASTQTQNGATSSQNQDLGHAHGGLLMALGLRGHLTTLEMTDIFDYLTQGTVTTTVGVLLGMAANMRGTCDISVSKMLCLHIPSLIPQHFSAIDVASTVQAAAVAGAGFLYQGSCHRMMTEFLLNEIGKRPSNDVNVVDREAYTLSCGIALGMVNLCQGEGHTNDFEGTGNAGLADLRIEDRLYRYIVGGLDDAEMRRRREEADRLSLPTTSASSGNEKCSCVYEGDSINTDVTSPGATLAMGLIYMKSGNKTIASAISLPDTHFLLEYVRPDFLMLRVVARALILWDDVEPSRAWIESQLPSAVKGAYVQMRDLAEKLSHQAGTSPMNQDKEFDRQAVRLMYSHVIAGACFALALRFAGTGNSDAAAAIFERVMELRDLRDGNDPVSCALRPVSPVLEMCLGCAAISLAMVLSGTGDLETLRLLKVLRWRCDEEVNYGSHMAYGTAIGLLFLGGGTCTLGREPEDIAALVMAFYPRFPATTSDNQYHLQALRNLYALAVKHREIRAVDVDTGESVFVPTEVHFEDPSESPLSLTTPCLLSNTDAKPRELRVVSERYYPVTMEIDYPPTQKIFFVKRRSAHLSYRQDPHSQRSLLVQTGSFQGGSSLNLIASFTDDETVLAFAKYFCDVDDSTPTLAASGPFSVAGFCRRVLHECLILDTQEALPVYLGLRGAVTTLRSGASSAFPFVWDFRLIRSYYQHRRRLVSDDSPRLLNSELITYLDELLEGSLKDLSFAPAGKRKACQLMRDGSISVYYDSPIEWDVVMKELARHGDNMDLT